ncbi:MAG: hypothetical protein HKM02_02285 [Pseudomonadales bacterium]|nr:hypothetical protein [Pseudomonadales bacterium]
MSSTSMHGHWPHASTGTLLILATTLGLGQTIETAAVGLHHGGLIFLLPLLICILLLALPLRMAELALGRRSQRGLIDGMAALTREADAPRFYRIWSWGALAASLLALSLAGLCTGWSLAYLLHLTTSTAAYPLDYTPMQARWLPLLGIALAFVISSICSDRGWLRLPHVLYGLGSLLLLLLLTCLTWSGWPGTVPHVLFQGSTWLLAMRLALLLGAGNLGIWYMAAVYLPRDTQPARFALLTSMLQLLLVTLMMIVLQPLNLPDQSGSRLLIVSIPRALANSSAIHAASFYLSMAIAGIFAMTALLEPMHRMLIERKMPARSALLLTATLGLLITGIWLISFMDLIFTTILVILSLLLCLFTGWAMKISHLRKTLNLSSEFMYNLWRVAVRILIPLVLLWMAIHLRSLGG